MSPLTHNLRRPSFDKFSFVKYIKNIGRAYRKQAVELVSLCRTFVQVQAQTPDSHAQLNNGLQAVDDALSSAAGVKKTTSEEVDKAFERAIEVLNDYEAEFHPKKSMSGDSTSPEMTVYERMVEAKTNDTTSSSRILNVLKGKPSRKASEEVQPEPTTGVEFLLLKSLPDKNPTIVKQVLSERSTLSEILWNFSRFEGEKRLALKQNPHFYEHSKLPTSPESYVDNFRTDPIDSFTHAKICVLIDRPGVVFLEADQKTRTFGNVWVPKDAIILKDVCGKLEGESIVQASISGATNSWYLEELPPSPTPPSAVSPNRSCQPPISSSTNSSVLTHSAEDGSFHDWKEPIRRSLSSPDNSIYIRALSPNKSNPGFHATPSPSPSAAFISTSSCVSGSSSSSRNPTRSLENQTPRPARRTLAPRGSLLSKLSSRRQVPSSTSLFVPSPRQAPISASPLTNQATLAPERAYPVVPTCGYALTRQEPQDRALTEEPPISMPDASGPVLAVPLLNTTNPTPSGATSPRMPHLGGREAKNRGIEPYQAGARDPVPQIGAARPASRQDFTPVPEQDGGAECCRNKPSQADISGSIPQKKAAMQPPYPGPTPVQLQYQGKVGRLQWSGVWQFCAQLVPSRFKG